MPFYDFNIAITKINLCFILHNYGLHGYRAPFADKILKKGNFAASLTPEYHESSGSQICDE